VSRPVGGLHGVGDMGDEQEESKPWEPEPDEQRMEEGYEERTRVLSVLELEELFQTQSPDLNGQFSLSSLIKDQLLSSSSRLTL
jgi:hypothetical protein